MSSISIRKAQATHDVAMDILAKEARERAAKTEHLRRLRLAAEAEGRVVSPAAGLRVKTRKKA